MLRRSVTMMRAAACSTRKRIPPVLAALAVLLLLAAPASAAEGGTSIASAPVLSSGELESGTGAHDIPGGGSSGHDFGHAFWRVQVFAGDRITGSGSESESGSCLDSMWLYDPSVTDATLDRAKATLQTAVTHSGGTCNSRTFRWTWRIVPFKGVATVWADFGFGNTYTFVAHVSHRTVVRLAPVPVSLSSPRATVLLGARVTSAAGTPAGICAFERRAQGRGRWHQVRQVGLHAGRCASRVAASATGSVQFRVRFVPSAGWLPSVAVTRRLSIA
jgi:hypothetical protein